MAVTIFYVTKIKQFGGSDNILCRQRFGGRDIKFPIQKFCGVGDDNLCHQNKTVWWRQEYFKTTKKFVGGDNIYATKMKQFGGGDNLLCRQRFGGLDIKFLIQKFCSVGDYNLCHQNKTVWWRGQYIFLKMRQRY